ncbi:thiamine-phosphate kinase [Microbulbifer hydrolyticus]|uniref:Thiamine-monophosphate kinase n=1 Tax=Microbulbifer hydrolyticus TaxID=48074 RepID=A0A6P1TBW7_9GAMM|nr:thiamine-phosphate kinase [Microbulbifer hydrolyticus]MBB5211037.1 thiamine-monophosphate kinase [Microbulbifer hydrolyticus]QHQ38162.1 thiamine-phosphate kinase [Microbulbifer hydrolyticus]
MAGPGEFELIREYFSSRFQTGAQAGGVDSGVVLGIGDDCALLTPPRGKMLATSVDTLVADVHFPASADPYRIASRALRVNLSDLAGMNAEPLWFTLALTLPESNAAWLEPFARGLADTARLYGITLIGGDTTKGPLSITVQVTGSCDRALRRDGASAGDHIFVSNQLGAAAAALPIVLEEYEPSEVQQQQADAAFYFPEPQLELARSIGACASAGLDISDGLLADLAHICEASGLGADLKLDTFPIAELAQSMSADAALETALTGGDDYQLCFTVPAKYLDHLQGLQLPITAVGRMREARGIDCFLGGKPWQPRGTGYRHF